MTPDHESPKDKFLRIFPNGFADSDYLKDERCYKTAAHIQWGEILNKEDFGRLIAKGDFSEVVKRAVRVVAKTKFMWHSIEAAAFHDATRKKEDATTFAKGLYHLVYGSEPYETRFEAFVQDLTKLSQPKTTVLKWPIVTLFPFIARPQTYLFLKPQATKFAAKQFGVSLNYKPSPNFLTYSCLLNLGGVIKDYLADLKPRDRDLDMVDIQSFIWVMHYYAKE